MLGLELGAAPRSPPRTAAMSLSALPQRLAAVTACLLAAGPPAGAGVFAEPAAQTGLQLPHAAGLGVLRQLLESRTTSARIHRRANRQSLGGHRRHIFRGAAAATIRARQISAGGAGLSEPCGWCGRHVLLLPPLLPRRGWVSIEQKSPSRRCVLRHKQFDRFAMYI